MSDTKHSLFISFSIRSLQARLPFTHFYFVLRSFLAGKAFFAEQAHMSDVPVAVAATLASASNGNGNGNSTSTSANGAKADQDDIAWFTEAKVFLIEEHASLQQLLVEDATTQKAKYSEDHRLKKAAGRYVLCVAYSIL
jgi:hypothetical protein